MNHKVYQENRTLILLGLPVVVYMMSRPSLLFVTSWETWLFVDYLGRILVLGYVFLFACVRIEVQKMFQPPWLEHFGLRRALFFVGAIACVLLFELLINLLRPPLFDLFASTVLFRTYYIEIRFWLFFDLTIGLMLVALSEEILFRGCLFQVIRKFAPHPIVLIGLSSLIFGAMHWPSGVHNIVVTTLSGVAFGCLYYWSKSLVPSVIAHYLVNLGHFWPT